MGGMARPSSVLCPSCGSLVGVRDRVCLNCGRHRPGLWGFSRLLRNVGDETSFATLVMWACGILFLATLAVDPAGIQASGLLSFLSPSVRALFLFGASGAAPVFGYHRWWTVLSAAWLHGGILHILFNMWWVRDLGPTTAQLYGVSRTAIIYTVAAVTGFLLSSTAGFLVPFLPLLHGAVGITIGASAPIFGLIGALLYYGRRGGGTHISQQAKYLALVMLVFGFVVPDIDNVAHLGGLAGGYLTAKLLDPLKPERGDHVLLALGCLLASLAAVVASVVYGRGFLR
jgi:rhomboid protease GluP